MVLSLSALMYRNMKILLDEMELTKDENRRKKIKELLIEGIQLLP